jgi:large subunit ribosomal protein L10
MTERTTYPQKKVDAIGSLESLIKDSNSIYLADFSGLNVDKITELRDRMFEQGIPFVVAKNTLTKIALNNCGITDLDEYLVGNNALAFGNVDPARPAKILFEFAKKNQKPEVKSCLFEGVKYGPDKIQAIKDLPSRDEIIAQLVGQIQAPLSQFVGVLNEIVRSFLGVLEAVIQQKEAGK